ncbi:MAG: hypothetical protein E6G66_17545 [Actinobacteria bacterium]|nr:MAG: hypothetical protein E6G66_17545 [Actinomycetota bacterium]
MAHHRPGDDGGDEEEDAEYCELRAEPSEDLDRGNPEPRDTLGLGRGRLGLGCGSLGGQERRARRRAFSS